MGCGRVDLIELFDLARNNMGGVRKRELEAHLQGCSPCTQDVKKLATIVSVMKTIANATNAVPSPRLIASIQVEMQKGAVDFKGVKARNLWAPQEKPPITHPRRRIGARILRGATSSLRWIAVVVVLAVLVGAIAVGCFRANIAKGLVWKVVDRLPHHPLLGKVLGIADREELNASFSALPNVEDGMKEKFENASKWLMRANAPKQEMDFLELAAKCVQKRPKDAELLEKVKGVWEEAQAAPFEKSLALYVKGCEMIEAALAGETQKASKAEKELQGNLDGVFKDKPATQPQESGGEATPLGTIVVHGKEDGEQKQGTAPAPSEVTVPSGANQ